MVSTTPGSRWRTRSRDLATLRILGFTRGEVAVVFLEARPFSSGWASRLASRSGDLFGAGIIG